MNIHWHHGKRGSLYIGHHTSLSQLSSCDNTGNVFIGDYATITDGVKIFTHKHDYKHSRELRENTSKLIVKNIEIGPDAYIGQDAIIICASIGRGAVVGAGAIVTKDVPPYEIWAGNPARKINERTDKREDDNPVQGASA